MGKIKKLNNGAGCGASDLLVAAVILDPKNPIEGLNDSKKLTEKKREVLYPEIIEKALDYCIIHVSPQEIDKINILQARMERFRRAITGLKKVKYAIIDGNKIPEGLAVDIDYLVVSSFIIVSKTRYSFSIILSFSFSNAIECSKFWLIGNKLKLSFKSKTYTLFLV